MTDSRFKDVEYLVEADSFSRLVLWSEYKGRFDWKSDDLGLLECIGYLNERPIICTFKFDRIDGHLICFYTGFSRLVDWDMIDKWVEDNIGCKNHTNAMNFSCVASYIMRHKN